MERFVAVAVIVVIAALAAAVVQRRRPAAEPAPTGYAVPSQLHRADFARPEAPWLVVVFTSATCHTCAGMWEKARHLASEAVAVEEAEVSARRDLHERYAIDAVPITLVADHQGVVRASFLGPTTATDLWAAVAELREPGTVPEACHHPTPEDV